PYHVQGRKSGFAVAARISGQSRVWAGPNRPPADKRREGRGTRPIDRPWLQRGPRHGGAFATLASAEPLLARLSTPAGNFTVDREILSPSRRPKACPGPNEVAAPLQIEQLLAAANRDDQRTIVRWPYADVLGAHAREHILGEANQHCQGDTLIEFQRED